MEEHGIKKGDKFIMPSWYDCTKPDGKVGYSYGGLNRDGVEVKVVSVLSGIVNVSPISPKDSNFSYKMLASELIPTKGKEDYSLTF